MSTYNIVLSDNESTVVTEYIPEEKRSADYQSEADLEKDFVKRLCIQGYEYVNIKNESALLVNLRKQLERLNDYAFSDNEWTRFFKECIANQNDGIVEKTRKIQDDYVQVLKQDNGTTKNIRLIDKANIHNNHLQVVNQYEATDGNYQNRYDVTILVNGLPLVHVELKRRGVHIKEAFNQINRYQRDSFWSVSGLYHFVQIFVISNGTNTKYYSNTTRDAHVNEQHAGQRSKSKKTSHSFEFTSHWADAQNKNIPDLVDFARTFFAKHTLLNILTRYCVFTSENILLVMRPYQIVATERILQRIVCSAHYKKMGTTDAGGYIWHTTGSGKTLTSFKTAQLATQVETVEKVLFVVDRKDLDYQTMKEYDRFEKGAANGSKSTKELEKNLNDPNAQIIITTIQKLGVFISRNKMHDIYKKHVVLIFDECHRSQFGEMHRDIIKTFRNYHIFGFTGTPIFASNTSKSSKTFFKTTEQAFGDKLHSYTIVDAINDRNVLPFRVGYISTAKKKPDIKDKKVTAIDIEKAMNAPERVREVVRYILAHFDQQTKRHQSSFEHRVIRNVKKVACDKYQNVAEETIKRRMKGFNSIFAVSSIPMAMKYYEEFKKQNSSLKIATIFSFSVNEDDLEDALPDEDFDNDKLDKPSRDFLESAITDYNASFRTNYDTSVDKFQNYYKDVSMRVKNREIDLLLVVNMFLTGFDATTLNTLWVDKNLRLHGLLQAFSRTNRILNSVKTHGNIICFRPLQQEVDEAIALFGNKEAGGIVLLKSYKDYYNGYEQNGKHQPGYVELIAELVEKFPLGEEIVGEKSQKKFIRLYGAILRLKNILTMFDDFEGNEILSMRDFQDYQSVYLDFYQKFRQTSKGDKENINDDIVFEVELIRQIEVNIDYILMMVEQYHAGNCKDEEVRISIIKAIDSSFELRSKKELIELFIERVHLFSDVIGGWQEFVCEQRERDLSTLISDEKLKEEEARRFVSSAFRDGVLRTTGTDIDGILPPVSRFGGGNRAERKQTIIDKLMLFFEKYWGLG